MFFVRKMIIHLFVKGFHLNCQKHITCTKLLFFDKIKKKLMNKLTIIIPQTTKRIQKVRNIAFYGANFYVETWLTTLSQLLALSFSTLHILQHVA